VDLAPDTPQNRVGLCRRLREASAARRPVRIVGGGTGGRRGRPGPPDADEIPTAGFDRIVAHEPADLVVTVEGGVRADRLQTELAAYGQTWMQAPDMPGATVGGLLSRAASGPRRLRYGAIRDSVLQVVLVTGDGRLVTSGGKTVKGVAGYDIPRLVVGSHGTLGVIVDVTLKLWPIPPTTAWFTARGTTAELADLAEAVRRDVHQPGAILLGPDRLDVELIGPEADLVAPAGLVPADPPPTFTAPALLEAGVPPATLPDLAAQLAERDYPFEAQSGVGVCRVAVADRAQRDEVRALAIAAGGHAWLADGPDALRDDPWGPSPAGLAIMQRLKSAFDPAGVLNRGQFIGDPEGPSE
jgi:glycolate oxidase FAD binding subunit